MTPLELVSLPLLMERTMGRPEIAVALIDGPVATDHPDLAAQSIRIVPGSEDACCCQPNSVACAHGTFVAGILTARRGANAPAICPNCTLLIRSIFREDTTDASGQPNASAQQLAAALVDAVNAGARIVNVSAALSHASLPEERELEAAIDLMAKRGVIAVMAAGNEGKLSSTVLTRHRWTIPVAACDPRGRPTRDTNLGWSIGIGGLSAPGERVASLGADGHSRTLCGTSAAAPFVTGTIALLWSAFPHLPASRIKLAVLQADRRRSVVPPVLNAYGAYQTLVSSEREASH
jgi:subtilisin family serine protease